jgi:hypothetical protein
LSGIDQRSDQRCVTIDPRRHGRQVSELARDPAQPLSRVGDFTMIAEDKHR